MWHRRSGRWSGIALIVVAATMVGCSDSGSGHLLPTEPAATAASSMSAQTEVDSTSGEVASLDAQARHRPPVDWYLTVSGWLTPRGHLAAIGSARMLVDGREVPQYDGFCTSGALFPCSGSLLLQTTGSVGVRGSHHVVAFQLVKQTCGHLRCEGANPYTLSSATVRVGRSSASLRRQIRLPDHRVLLEDGDKVTYEFDL